VICRQLEADQRSLSVLPSPLKHSQKLTPTAVSPVSAVLPVSADSVSGVALHADTATELSNAGQYHEPHVLFK